MPPRDTATSPPIARIDGERMAETLAGINHFGADAVSGGWDRQAFGTADMDVRAWFRDQMLADGFVAGIDPAGNVFGRFGPEGPAVMVGSHLDSVPAGGAFDGALGCAVALECVRAIRDAGIDLARPVEVIGTADEEGRFGGMLGSQALAGLLPDGWVDTAHDAGGLPLADAMRKAGLDPAAVAGAARPAGSLAAFLELHIEQGPVLESMGRDIAVATAISGCAVLDVTLVGAANHSGTTPMDLRRDAFVAMARIGAAVPDLTRFGTADARLTIGRAALSPNEPHTIPGEASFTVIVRDVERRAMDALCEAFEALVAEIAGPSGIDHMVERRSDLNPVQLDAGLADRLAGAARARGLDPVMMPSGAGHDTQMMATLCPSALLFVPSRGGISHAPAEHTDWPPIERGAQVLLDTIVALAQR